MNKKTNEPIIYPFVAIVGQEEILIYNKMYKFKSKL